MVELSRLPSRLPGRVVAKLEMRNPAGSVKDRLAVALIDDAERRGVLRRGMTLVEPTGGNTGIGLAFAAAIRGYRLVLTMPSAMSTERVAVLRHLGAEVVLTPGILMIDAVAKAKELVADTPGAVMLDQFANPANPEVHRRTTAVEIWDDTHGAVDYFVAGVGTGGTITGVGEAPDGLTSASGRFRPATGYGRRYKRLAAPHARPSEVRCHPGEASMRYTAASACKGALSWFDPHVGCRCWFERGCRVARRGTRAGAGGRRRLPPDSCVGADAFSARHGRRGLGAPPGRGQSPTTETGPSESGGRYVAARRCRSSRDAPPSGICLASRSMPWAVGRPTVTPARRTIRRREVATDSYQRRRSRAVTGSLACPADMPRARGGDQARGGGCSLVVECHAGCHSLPVSSACRPLTDRRVRLPRLDATTPATPGASTARHLLALRTILTSGRAALARTGDPSGRERVKERVTELLASLEEAVLRDGADPVVLARLEEARREMWA